jgi:opacity protein-like surface antigen
MKKSILITTALLSTAVCFAQEQSASQATTSQSQTSTSGFKRFVKQSEIEFYYGGCLPLGSYHGGKEKLRYADGLNARYQLGNSPWKLGLYIQMDNAARKYYIDGKTHMQKNEVTAAGVTTEYNFRVTKTINPFIGIGVGGGAQEATGDVIYPHDGGSYSVIPRIGLELWHSVRINAYTQFCRKGYNTVGLNIGFVIGGRSQF